jgi:NAD(P)-dependent dehydrogenase (short-subunit alcohol dehydrogenase family)
LRLEDKVIVITGAGGGIGAALAKCFALCRPAGIRLVDLDLAPLEALAGQLDGVDISIARCDVTDERAVADQVASVVERYGRVDLFCSNAGVFIPGDEATLASHWDLAMGVNLMAHIHAAKACLPVMLEKGSGYFLNTISAAGLLCQIGSAPYTVSKHAALGFAEWLAITYGERGIGVTALCPQGVATAMLADLEDVNSVASDGLLSPEDVAACALRAIESEQFLALPHPEVASYFQGKAADHDRWIRGMQKFQDKLATMRNLTPS